MAPKFAPSNKFVRLLNKLNPFEPRTIGGPRKDFELEHYSLQEHVEEETKSFGLSVSLAQFLTFQGGRVRFAKIPEWISKDLNYNKMPMVSEMSNPLVAIDLSHLNIDAVTIKAVPDISSVTFFSVEGCPFFDDFCLDQLSAKLPGLEELNLSDCPMITSRGLGVLYRFKRLRSLNLKGIPSNPELELLCILLEEHFPELKIEGVTYEAINIDAN